jgi:hypothetical protein
MSTTARFIIMSEAETDSVLQSAADCADGECSVDDVTEFLSDLQEQKKVLQQRLDQIMNMIADLQHLNEHEDREPDSVRALVRDMLRVFSHDEKGRSGFVPSGYTGDIGTTDAYSSLAPKKWKPADK